MANTVRHFRDNLTIDLDLISRLGARAGDTLVLGARQAVLSALVPYFDYVIAVDQLTVPASAGTNVSGDGVDVTVLARNIEGALNIISAGVDGSDGVDGEPGEPGMIEEDPRGKPVLGPGGNGGAGGNGDAGGAGGRITILYASASQTPTGSAPGGKGGLGGRGGSGGMGRPPGRRGAGGRPGLNGPAGTVDIRQVDIAEVWTTLDSDSAQGWAAYRAEVAGYLFRKFDFDSQLAALNETNAALLLNPADSEALTIQSRIVNRQVPCGLPRDLDIAPDFPGLSANLLAEMNLVNSAFQSFVSAVSLEAIAESIRQNLSVVKVQLVNRREEAQADIEIALQDVAIASAEKANFQKQFDDVQKEIDDLQNDPFSIGDFFTTVGTIAGAVAGIATGAGALVSIPAAIASIQSVVDRTDNIALFIGELGNAAKDPKNKTKFEQDIAAVNGMGGDLKDLVKGTKSVISLLKVVSDIDSGSGQGAVKKLLKQQATLGRQRMIAAMREKQAQSRVAASQQRVGNLTEEITDIDQRLSHWNVEIAFLQAASELLIRAARELVDMVMEDVFLAQRAHEIYQLEPAPGLRFDYGFLHPDVDRSLTSIQRATTSLVSLSGMPVQILSWIQMYQQLNTAQIGFDVIHPQLSLTISDPAQLQAFASGSQLSFTIGLDQVPQGMFELKANALGIQLNGASATQSSNIWITHSGEWSINRRTDGSLTTMTLRPRREVFAIGQGTGTLEASIPANPQSNSESGPPFSFWGRGIATTFRLQIAPPSAMDLSQLSSVHITVDCIGYSPQVAGAQFVITPPIEVTAAPLLLAEAVAA